MARLICTLVLGTLLSGCYYMQAASGQLSLMSKREPIAKVLASGELTPAEAAQLREVQAALAFAVSDLKLPDNGSYRSFVRLPENYVVWNVFAAPELSLTPRQWCFPVVGCVAYRGYFSEARAQRYAARVATEGFDVTVRGAGAYSTLGRFKDPILSSMLSGEPLRLVMTLFHELAHQELYVRDDVEFNESYASAVADIGIERWVAGKGQAEELAAFRQRIVNYRRFAELSLAARDTLEKVYAGDLTSDQKRERKAEVFAQLAEDYARLAKSLSLSTMPRPPASNAELAPVSTYNALIPAFRHVYAACEQSMACFHQTVREIGELKSLDERRLALAEYQP